ncbi:MAG: trigger factor [Kiritimatiellae bacterium]|nr:trigger factor [Kiritimatiellia bacterium]MCO5067519.1 trigger factor [Kiritimatiellia bacterium]
MNIRIESSGPCRREVHVEMPAERVQSAFAEVTTSYMNAARVPGFRPGRAPRDMIRRRYQKEIVDDVKERLVPEGYQAAVKQEKISTVAVLDVREEKLEEGQPFAFSVIVDVAPDFELPGYKGISLTREIRPVTESDVDSALLEVREQQVSYAEVTDRPVQIGDVVQIDYEGTFEGQSIETLFPNAKGLGKGENFWLLADAQNEFMPGFSEALTGASIGETRQISSTFRADFSEAALAGKTASYTATVKAIRKKVLPEIDAAFLQGVGVDSLEALRERIRSEMGEMRKISEDQRLEQVIVRQLLDAATFDAPQSLLEEETRQEVYSLVQRTQNRGVSAEEIEGRKEELFETATRSATERVKLRFIVQRIAAEEKVSVTEQDVSNRIRALALAYGMPFDKLRADLEKNDAIKRIREEVLTKKVISHVLANAAVSEKEVAAT